MRERFMERLKKIGVQVSDDDMDTILDEIGGYFEPEDLFPEQRLEDWAYVNGFVPE